MFELNDTGYNTRANRTGHNPSHTGNTRISELTNAVRPVADYFIKALFYIKRILDFLIKTKPLIEQYGPIVKEMPKLYKMMKLLQSEDGQDQQKYEQVAPVKETQIEKDESNSEVKLFY